jgi:hypothetical protein
MNKERIDELIDTFYTNTYPYNTDPFVTDKDNSLWELCRLLSVLIGNGEFDHER